MKSFHLLILTSCTTPERTRLRDFEHPEKYSYQGTLSTATATTNADPLSCFDGNVKPTDDQTPLPLGVKSRNAGKLDCSVEGPVLRDCFIFHFPLGDSRMPCVYVVKAHQACNRIYGSFELCPVFDDPCQRFTKFVTLSNADPTKPVLILVRCKGVSIVI
jgi:hypothetical protein